MPRREKKKKGGGFAQWTKNADKDAQRREYDWRIPNKLFRRVTNEYPGVLYDIEDTLLGAHNADNSLDDRTLLDAMKCALGAGVSIDPRADELAADILAIRDDYSLSDGGWRDCLRVVVNSIHNHSALTPGATGYLTFIRKFLAEHRDAFHADEEDDDADDDADEDEDRNDQEDDKAFLKILAPGSAQTAALTQSLLDAIDPSPVMPVPWFQRQDWPRLLAAASDPETLPKTYDEWLQSATQLISETTPQRSVMAIHFDVEEWRQSCFRIGCPCDSHSRTLYITMKFFVVLGDLEEYNSEDDDEED